VPRTNCLGNASVANENGVYRRAEESLDERRRIRIGAYEITEGAKDRSFAEDAALLEQLRCRRCESNALPLQAFEGAQLGDRRGVQLLGAEEVGTRAALPLARLHEHVARVVRGGGGLCYKRRGDRGRILRRGQFSSGCFGGVKELELLGVECRSAGRDLRTFALAALAIELGAMELLAQVAQRTLAVFHIGASDAESRANLFLVPRVRAQSFVRYSLCSLELRELTGGAIELAAHPSGGGVTFAPLFFSALAA